MKENNKWTGTLKAFVLLVAVLSAVSCSSSRRAAGAAYGWELLGVQKVDFIRDRDEIIVNGNTRYTAVRFHVADRDIHISDLKIYFQNGDKLEPAIDENIGAGQDSRILDLDRDGRLISKVEFKYRTVGTILKGRAKVYVYAKRYDNDNR